jgi:hypothetical protein
MSPRTDRNFLEKKYLLPSPGLETQARPAHIGSLYAIPAEHLASKALVKRNKK